MKRNFIHLAAVAAVAASLSGANVSIALAQGALQTLATMRVDPASLASGYRTSRVVGSPIVNEANESIGKIDDLIVTTDEKVPYAVLSVGGFLGVGTKYVVVPASALEVNGKNMLLRGATKESLKALPPYTYTN